MLMGLVCRHLCRHRLKEERRKVEMIMEVLPKHTLKKKDDGPAGTAATAGQAS